VNFAFLMRLIKAFWEIDELSTQRQFWMYTSGIFMELFKNWRHPTKIVSITLLHHKYMYCPNHIWWILIIRSINESTGGRILFKRAISRCCDLSPNWTQFGDKIHHIEFLGNAIHTKRTSTCSGECPYVFFEQILRAIEIFF
jgi:hypothetical protein